MRTHLSLFSGIGGLDIAAEMAGFQTVGQCEWADFPTKVLEMHWPNVPRWRDIRTLTKESFYERTGLHTVDVISGGFPCQPFSQAGKQRGKEDDRYLWPEMLRVVDQLQPAFVVGENVTGIVRLALDQVLFDLEGIGYTCQALAVPAAGVDAPHKRERIVILAYSGSKRLQGDQLAGKCAEEPCKGQEGLSGPITERREVLADANSAAMETAQQHRNPSGQPRPADGSFVGVNPDSRHPNSECGLCGRENPQPVGVCKDVPHPDGCRLSGVQWREYAQQFTDRGWWPAEPSVGRMANGVPNRVDRLKCLGNAVVPQQFYPVFRSICDLMQSEEAAI